MATLKIINAAKVFNIAECVKLKPSTNYSDDIVRDTSYNGQSTKYVTVVNTCNHAFELSETTLFTDNVSGGSLRAYIKATHINANETKNIPIWYSGVMKNPATNPTYTIRLNGSEATFTANLTDKDLPPVASDKTIELDNRVNKTLTKADLTYSDPNSDPITHVRFKGDVSKLFTDSGMNTPYVANTELPISFTLYYKAPDQDAESTYTVQYDVKANGKWSA